MSSLVLIDCETGELQRLECGGSQMRLTHVAIPNEGPLDLSPMLIENFRVNPPAEFKIEPPPQPPLPPANIMAKPKIA